MHRDCGVQVETALVRWAGWGLLLSLEDFQAEAVGEEGKLVCAVMGDGVAFVNGPLTGFHVAFDSAAM